MSVVFGVMKVAKVVTSSEGVKLHCVDVDTNEDTGVITSSYAVPIGTKFYWETNLCSMKTTVHKL